MNHPPLQLEIPTDLAAFEGLWTLVRDGIDRVRPTKVLLFGSRATGRARPNSDFDIAFEFPRSQSAKWTRFVLDAQESPETLDKVDWVDYFEVSAELRESIDREGITIYG